MKPHLYEHRATRQELNALRHAVRQQAHRTDGLMNIIVVAKVCMLHLVDRHLLKEGLDPVAVRWVDEIFSDAPQASDSRRM